MIAFSNKCLLLDMIIKDIRLINKQLLNMQNMLDFEDIICASDLDALRPALDKLIDSLYVLKRRDLDDSTIERMMSETKSENTIRNELVYMLTKYAQDKKYDYDFVHLKTCVFMKKRLQCRFDKIFWNSTPSDCVEQFKLIVDMFADSTCREHFNMTIEKMISLCNKILDRANNLYSLLL